MDVVVHGMRELESVLATIRVLYSGTFRRCCGRGSKTEKSMTDSTLMVRMAATLPHR